jgi:hypothetical protein
MSATEVHSKLQPIFNSDWNLTQNTDNTIVYTSATNPFEEFRVSIEPTKINVAVPIPNSEVLYQTTLYSCDDVCDYIRSHLLHLAEIKEEAENSPASDSDDE